MRGATSREIMQIVKKSPFTYELQTNTGVDQKSRWEEFKKLFLQMFVASDPMTSNTLTFNLIDATGAVPQPKGQIDLSLTVRDFPGDLTYKAEWGMAPFGW